ncbi:hypothetical protein CDL15_Pgr009755 [Punica granatum]|uniref:Uncharacterized protein n=1 Tax=Punica granatum TaxID=22663 RepID=A0A218WUB2_PUNGR|nr:hypothetical protein CDL15_Pgr009755 [Punica granatum]PKI77136.1 hypothetical protein CRG98_002639 [Punica granatum]
MKLKNVVRFLGQSRHRSAGSRYSTKDAYVRVIHAGGREEQYRSPIPASQLMNKYPGMWVALPQVFSRPHESILCPDERLVLGQKYYMIPSTTANKLKRKFRARPGPLERKSTGVGSFSKEMPEEKPFESSNHETGIRFLTRKNGLGKKKPFVPPISKERSCRSIGWEPSLSSVQELSP